MPERYLGQTLGRYRIVRLLGVGAFAWVYEAVDLELEIPVALKVLRPEHTGNATAETRFRREATTAARLRHPNIVNIRDVGASDGITWVAMDLLPLTLGRRLQLQPNLPEADAVRLGLDVASALATAHAEGVVHRDIKPDNILISPAGQCVVCDFGLARALSTDAGLSATNQVLGTPHYFSPEQARGQEIDGRSDLYALGVMLYRATSGRLPFEGEDWYAVARQHIESPPPPLQQLQPQLSGAFVAVVDKLMAKRPDDRFASAGSLIDALATLPSAPTTGSYGVTGTPGDTTAVHAVPAGPFAWATGKRGAAIVALAAVAVVAVLLAFDRPGLGNLVASGSEPAADSLVADLDSALSDSAATMELALADSVPTTNSTPVVRNTTPPAPAFGTLEVNTEDGSWVWIDDRPMGTAPWRGTRVTPGVRVVRVSLDDEPSSSSCPYSTREDTVMINAGAVRRYAPRLSRCARVVVDVQPGDAKVTFVDGAGRTGASGLADRLGETQMPAGTWRVRAEAPRCAPYEATHVLPPGIDTVRVRMIC